MKPEWFELFEQYILGELDNGERLRFEQELADNAEMQEAFSLYKEIEDEMRFAVTDEKDKQLLVETLNATGRKYFLPPAMKTESPGVVLKPRRWFLAAAAVLIVAVTGYWLVSNRTADTQQLYAQYAQFENLSATRSGDTDVLLNKAITAYNQRKYSNALPLLAMYTAKDSSDKELVLALNICRLETGDYQAALNGLNEMITPANAFKYQAVWLKALVYLRQKNVADCIAVLKQIPSDADTYEQAQQLLKELK